MKIIVVASLAFSLTNFRGRLLAAMRDAGHDVIACAPDDDPEVRAALAGMGVTYRLMPMARAGLNPLVDLRTLWWLVRLIAAERPAIVLAYTQKPIIYAGLATRITGRGLFFPLVTGLGHAFAERGSRWLRATVAALYRAALARAETVFVYNDRDAADLDRHRIRRPGTRLVLVPGSGVDLARFAAEPMPIGPVTFLMIARLLRSKGLFEFAEAARIVQAVRPETRFQLLGPLDPNPAGIGQDQISVWAREGVLSYLGEARDVRPFLAAANVFVLPSWYREGLPRTILEAMAVGRPVITTDLPGCRDAVEHGRTGRLVPACDAGALAAAMLDMLDQPEEMARMGDRARRAAKERFSVERINEILLGGMGLLNDWASPRTTPGESRRAQTPAASLA